MAPGLDARHEVIGEQWLSSHFGLAVTEPIRLHVAAKRYLCAVDPGYAASLSAASQESLRLQGGPMTEAGIQAFIATPFAAEAATLRRWDDAAKTPGLQVAGLAHYRSRIERLVEER